ncbi:MAG: hypothetical protein JO307_17460 [Bryobacterales bacterium]|nr:hypothetical protein [Bryobacterales bacterium]MBV9400789.1 hypothetical protein [Bryobacterales bacterium]
MVHAVASAPERHRATIVRLAEYEAFSVLSRSPKPIGMPAIDAERALRESFARATLAPIHPGLAWPTTRHTLERGYAGGRVYDAAIALAAYDGGARLFLTWNVKHFLTIATIAPAGLEIRPP